ncbi:hypothetical protein KCU60_g7, partial [Aureobasidium melanogenum]
LLLRVCVLGIRTSRLLWQSHGRRRIRTVSSSCAAFWVALVSRRRLFSNTALIVLSGLVPSSLISPSQIFLPSYQIEGPGLKLVFLWLYRKQGR